MNEVDAAARGHARQIAALACLTGLALAGCGTYRAGAPGYAGTAGRTGQARTYAAMLGSAQPGRPVPASAVPRLRAMARRFAKFNGGHALSQATAVLTTHREALTSATPGDFVPGSGGVPVYLVTMQGQFTVNAPGPPGAAAPTGRYASLVLDARTFAGLDMGVGDNPPPVSPESLGPVTDLLLPPSAPHRSHPPPAQVRHQRDHVDLSIGPLNRIPRSWNTGPPEAVPRPGTGVPAWLPG